MKANRLAKYLKTMAIIVAFAIMNCALNTEKNENTIYMTGKNPPNLSDISKKGYSLIYGRRHFFSVVTPEGWRRGRHPKLPYIIIPAEKRKKKTYIYAAGADCPDGEKMISVEQWTRNNTKQLEERFPGLEVEEMTDEFVNLSKQDGLTGKYILTKYKYPDKHIECLLTIEAERTIITLVFSAKDKDGFDRFYPDYVRLIKSFSYGGSDVNVLR